MAGLKPSEELVAATFGVASVIAVFSTTVPNSADIRGDQVNRSNNSTVHTSIRAASITSAAIVSGVALLAKSPTVFIAGAAAIVIMAVEKIHANATSSVTGKPTTSVGE